MNPQPVIDHNRNQESRRDETAETPHVVPYENTAESVLAAQLNVPRGNFKRWREGGELKPGEHWIKDGHAFFITEAGKARVLELLGFEPGTKNEERITRTAVRVMLPGAMPRVLRCKVENGGMCSVRLTAPRVFAAQFRRHDRLEVLPTETEGIFEYDGGVPRRIRI